MDAPADAPVFPCAPEFGALSQPYPTATFKLLHPKDADAIEHPQRYGLTESAHADRFAQFFGAELRFDHRRNHWLVWNGQRWAEDALGRRYALAVETAKRLLELASAEPDANARKAIAKFALAAESKQRLENVLHLARFVAPISVAGDTWDADPWVLNTPGGLVDLRTGTRRPALPTDHVTLITRATPDGNPYECLRFWQFLREIFNGDEALIEFVWRYVGYCLTGLTTEQAFVLCVGSGANGKGTLLNLFFELLGDYALNLPFSTLERHQHSSIPNDLAKLPGRRFVIASETNAGSEFHESRIKMLTGGDPVTARFLHGEFFSFVPVAKLLLAVNHRPRVRDTTHAFWRRLRLVPFTQTFPINKHLADNLRDEGPAILAWAIEGCLRWQRDGLPDVSAVEDANADYRADSDPLGAFLDARCELGDSLTAKAGDVQSAYLAWAELGLTPRERLGTRALGELLKARFASKRAAAPSEVLARYRAAITDETDATRNTLVRLIERFHDTGAIAAPKDAREARAVMELGKAITERREARVPAELKQAREAARAARRVLRLAEAAGVRVVRERSA